MSENQWVVGDRPTIRRCRVGMDLGMFVGVEEFDLKGEMKWKWTWKIMSGKHSGELATALTNKTIHPTSPPGVLDSGLAGQGVGERRERQGGNRRLRRQDVHGEHCSRAERRQTPGSHGRHAPDDVTPESDGARGGVSPGSNPNHNLIQVYK